MASRRLAISTTYPRPDLSMHGATRMDLRSLVLVIGLLALMASAGVLYLSQAGAAAALRYRLAEAERQAQDLSEESSILRQQIADNARLAAVEEHARRMGMVDGSTAGPYLACVATEPGSVSANVRGAASPQEAGGMRRVSNDLWHDLMRWLGFAQEPGEKQLVIQNAKRP